LLIKKTTCIQHKSSLAQNTSYLSEITKHQLDVSTFNQRKDPGTIEFNSTPIWLPTKTEVSIFKRPNTTHWNWLWRQKRKQHTFTAAVNMPKRW
jgi:hypothetical protein